MLNETAPLLAESKSSNSKFSTRGVVSVFVGIAIVGVIAFSGLQTTNTDDVVTSKEAITGISEMATMCPSTMAGMAATGPYEIAYFSGAFATGTGTQSMTVSGSNLALAPENKYFPYFVARTMNTFMYDSATCTLTGDTSMNIENYYPFLYYSDTSGANKGLSSKVMCNANGAMCQMVFTSDLTFKSNNGLPRRLRRSSSSSSSGKEAAKPKPKPTTTTTTTTTKQPTTKKPTTKMPTPKPTPMPTTRMPTKPPTKSVYECADLIGEYTQPIVTGNKMYTLSAVGADFADAAKLTDFAAMQATGCLFKTTSGEGAPAMLYYCPDGLYCDIMMDLGVYVKIEEAFVRRTCANPYSVVGMRIGFIWRDVNAPKTPYREACVV